MSAYDFWISVSSSFVSTLYHILSPPVSTLYSIIPPFVSTLDCIYSLLEITLTTFPIVRSIAIWYSVPEKNFIVPVIHLQIGLGIYILNNFLDVVWRSFIQVRSWTVIQWWYWTKSSQKYRKPPNMGCKWWCNVNIQNYAAKEATGHKIVNPRTKRWSWNYNRFFWNIVKKKK